MIRSLTFWGEAEFGMIVLMLWHAAAAVTTVIRDLMRARQARHAVIRERNRTVLFVPE